MSNKYTKRTPIMKTIQFGMNPVQATYKILKSQSIVEKQFLLSEKADKLIKYADEYQKEFINRILDNNSLDFTDLEVIMKEANEDNSKIEKAIEKKRKEIEKLFKSDKQFSEFKSTKLFTHILPDKVEDPEAQELFELFKRKGTYFSNYIARTQRKYTCEDKANSIGNRIFENFTIFRKNAECIDIAVKELGEEIVCNLLHEFGHNTSSFCSSKSYNKYLSQNGLEKYNQIISGTENIKGYNIKITEYNQKNNAHIPLLNKLKNQIGFAESKSTFEALKILTDEQLKEEIKAFIKLDNEANIPDLIDGWTITSPEDIHMRKNALAYASIVIYEKYDILPVSYDDIYGSKKSKLSLQELSYSVSHAREIGLIFNDSDWFDVYKAKILDLYSKARILHNDVSAIIESTDLIKGNDNAEEILKKYLDNYTEFRRAIAIFDANDTDDMIFYETLIKLKNICTESNNIYNKVRNYITAKPSLNVKKTAMDFDFTSGLSWSAKDNEKLTVPMLLIFEEDYYIGIPNKNIGQNKSIKINSFKDEQNNTYKRMLYKSIDPMKALPKMIWTKKVREHFENSSDDYDMDGLNLTKEMYTLCYLPDESSGNKKYTMAYLKDDEKNADTYKAATATWISLCIKFLKSNSFFKGYDFSRLKDAREYKSVNEFYIELTPCCYAIGYDYIPAEVIDELTKEGKLLLFKLYSRGLTQMKNNKSNTDEQAKYFRDIFYDAASGEIPSTRIYNPTISYRDKAISKPYTHKKGSCLVSKRSTDGEIIPKEVYTEIFNYVNSGKKPLSKAAAAWIDKVSIKDASFDIIKDRRYTVPQFTIHIPVTLNYAANTNIPVSSDILEEKNIEKANILAITRGERNLISLVLTDADNNIIWSKNLNEINGCDYKKSLTDLSISNQQLSRQWKEVKKTSNLKDSYLENAISIIIRLAIENKAIIAVEDLSISPSSFGRKWLDNKVFAKFNEKLISRLACFSLKERDDHEPGGVLNPLQLTDLDRKWFLNGIVLKINPAYIANVDPKTGFIPQFKWNKYPTQARKKEFFMKFKRIEYNKLEDVYEFEFDYKDYTDKPIGNSKWCVKSFGTRTKFNSNSQMYENIDLTQAITKILNGQPAEYITSGELSGKEYAQLFDIFRLIVQLRNYTETDAFTLSPVRGTDGRYYNSLQSEEDSDTVKTKLLAVKGRLALLRLIDSHINGSNAKQITSNEWISYLQNQDNEK